MTRAHEPPPIDPASHAIFLDFDGTLAELVDDPDAVALPEGTLDPLIALQRACGGALAIVSGRKVSDLDRFLAPLSFAAAGVHGLERRVEPGGETTRLMTADELDPVREALNGLVEENPRLQLEDKGLALVVHYRTAPDLKDTARSAVKHAVKDRDDLLVMDGDNIVEVHPAGMNKGRALAAMMEDAPFKGRIPVYAGDDTTDEYALEEVKRRGGISIKVGSRNSAAEYRLADVEAVHRWIAETIG
ncbi:HAD-superfamily hydrolase subfamily IIB [Fulvimarina pelagi HTCC2506]|uniref:Trehalose 6-phosphate phosphatase n=1 Tax=Fulvimarina pelagi HTCC2506 TaxID=314231 RepID=Q0G4F2_9HYPH|nr:trehalose-phosphatase [Fulvimarina pelagi]EAU41529.1 HAD-superfamily hydrolase subfamily IIB [Fulvimarina pelagi HTCC2506]